MKCAICHIVIAAVLSCVGRLPLVLAQQDAANEKDGFALSASRNVPTLQIPSDLELDPLLKEPLVANPLYINFDERGRMWLVQYRQYPWPAGLKLVSRDKVWRNTYDPPFAPPPPHAIDSRFRGHDRITIHEDTNGDGRYDQHKTFLDGLNFCSAALKGRDGVFVLNPPYLLFYADKNNDDVPDDPKPQVLLSGFGFEDSHSLPNNLRWGPDGWIYATQGSTVSASVVRHGANGKPVAGEAPRHTMGQNIWRYHPERHQYEVFAEGGGNAFGVEFDSKGRVYSGHNGGDTRGFHYVQGGYYRKTFGKHGSLSNPYAFTYFQPMKHPAVKRFTHTFEIYESTALPSRYHGKLFALDPHVHYIVHSSLFPDRSSWQTRDIAKVAVPGTGKRANWFSPVDIQTGPDGALYVADWFSVQTKHYESHQGKTNPDLGRIYRIRGKEHRFVESFDLSRRSSEELVSKFLAHTNRWHRETALRLLGDRKDATIIPLLKRQLAEHKGQYALECLWALHLSGGFDDATASNALRHGDPHVRRWAVRLLGDRPHISPQVGHTLVAMAKLEPDVETCSQLTSTARRVTPDHGLDIVTELLGRSSFQDDVHIPALIWWAVEMHADKHDMLLGRLKNDQWWNAATRVQGATLPECLMRRWALAGTNRDLVACGQLLERAPTKDRSALTQAFVKAFESRPMPPLPDSLASALKDVGGFYGILLDVRRGDETSIRHAIQVIEASKASDVERVQLVQAVGDVGKLEAESISALLAAAKTGPSRVRHAALVALQSFDDARVAAGILEIYRHLPKDAKTTAQTSLASRAGWSKVMLAAIDKKQMNLDTIEQETIDRVRVHGMKIPTRGAARFPEAQSSADALRRRVKALATILRGGSGVAKRGQALFHDKANCGKCHAIYGAGGDIGPDLTSYHRGNIEHMLLSVVHPGAEIREGYESYNVVTDDGQVLSGFKVREDDQLVVIRGADGQNRRVSKESIDEIVRSKTSLMPTGLLDNLGDQELRDLFAFLSSTTPPY